MEPDLIIIVTISFIGSFVYVFWKLIIAWFNSNQTMYPLSFGKLFGMFLRKLDLEKMIAINNQIQNNNLDLELIEVEEYYHRVGNLDELMEEVINAKNNYKEFNFREFIKKKLNK